MRPAQKYAKVSANGSAPIAHCLVFANRKNAFLARSKGSSQTAAYKDHKCCHPVKMWATGAPDHLHVARPVEGPLHDMTPYGASQVDDDVQSTLLI